MATTISDVLQSDEHCRGLSAWDIPAVRELREPTCDLAVSQLAWKCLGMYRKINQGLSFLFTGVVAELRADSASSQRWRSIKLHDHAGCTPIRISAVKGGGEGKMCNRVMGL